MSSIMAIDGSGANSMQADFASQPHLDFKQIGVDEIVCAEEIRCRRVDNKEAQG
jgi:hypothetical protein